MYVHTNVPIVVLVPLTGNLFVRTAEENCKNVLNVWGNKPRKISVIIAYIVNLVFQCAPHIVSDAKKIQPKRGLDSKSVSK